jgi:NADH-quinone oxidoreductase subunit N
VSDLLHLLPGIVLVAAALALIVIARRVTRPPFAAICVVIAAAGAIVSGWAVPDTGSGFGNTVASDGFARFFNVLFAATLALSALLSVKTVETERVPPAEYYALLLLAGAGMMLAASALDLLILYLGLELMTLCAYILVGITPSSWARSRLRSCCTGSR